MSSFVFKTGTGDMTILLNMWYFLKYHVSAWKKNQNVQKLGWGENIQAEDDHTHYSKSTATVTTSYTVY